MLVHKLTWGRLPGPSTSTQARQGRRGRGNLTPSALLARPSVYRGSVSILLFKRLGTPAPRRTPSPFAVVSNPCATSPARHELKKTQESRVHFTHSSTECSSFSSCFLFSKRWTRKGEGTPPTLCATALCLLALRQASLSPLTPVRSCPSHYARVSTTPSSTEAPSEILHLKLARRACANASEGRNGKGLLLLFLLSQQPPAF